MNDVKDLVETIDKEFGEGSIMVPEYGPTSFDEKVDVISTGSDIIDEATGIGGFPQGRIVEILGAEASGKTTLALSTIAQAQKLNMRCAYIDTEQALDKTRAENLGVDFDTLMISQPDNGEQALNILEALILSGKVNVVVIDSVAALTPKSEVEGAMDDANVGGLARLMGKACRKLVAPINKQNVLVIFVNQIRAKLGGFGYIPQETTPGGNALKFYATMRVDMRRTGNNKKGDTLVSTEHKVTIKKNKLAVPMRIVKVKIGKNGFI